MRTYNTGTPHKISRHIACEVAELAEYNVVLWHIPGKANGRADTLSRCPDYDQGTHDNKNITVLPDSLFICSLTIEEPLYKQKMLAIRKWTDTHRLKEFGGKWYKEGRLVITGDAMEWKRIVKEFHDPPTAGHPGIARTKDLIACAYWWPKLQKDVEEYVKGCTQCQANKINMHAQKAPISGDDWGWDATLPDRHYGFHHEVTPVRRTWHHTNDHRSRMYENGPVPPMLRNHHSRGSSAPLPPTCIQVFWFTYEDHQR